MWDLVYVVLMMLDFHSHLPHLVYLLADIFSSTGQYLETSLFKTRSQPEVMKRLTGMKLKHTAQAALHLWVARVTLLLPL